MPRLSTCAASAALVLVGGCSDSLIGEPIGAYRINMALLENSCGSGALPFPDGLRYTAELRAAEPRGFWRLPGQGPIEGRYMDGRFEFSYPQSLELGSADAGTSGCIVLREEVLRGEVSLAPDAGDSRADAEIDVDAASSDAGAAAAPALQGEHVVSFRPDPSGRCRDERGPLSVFERLPCSARYRLTGSASKPF